MRLLDLPALQVEHHLYKYKIYNNDYLKNSNSLYLKLLGGIIGGNPGGKPPGKGILIGPELNNGFIGNGGLFAISFKVKFKYQICIFLINKDKIFFSN
jgi:hypothetical protein